jgi:hypothetical protein
MVGDNAQIRGNPPPSNSVDDIKGAVAAPGVRAPPGYTGTPVETQMSADSNTAQGVPPSTDDMYAPSAPEAPEPGMPPAPGAPQDTNYTAMQPSMMGQEQEYDQEMVGGGGYSAQPQGQEMGAATYPADLDASGGLGGYPQDAYSADAYQQYQPYQDAMSSDVITEISEQVVTEKLSVMQDKLEKALDFRTVAETKITSLNERLRRIEGILDRLQLSILQKVGDYVNDVRDIKQELVQTQESFRAIAPGLKKSGKLGAVKRGKSSSGVMP